MRRVFISVIVCVLLVASCSLQTEKIRIVEIEKEVKPVSQSDSEQKTEKEQEKEPDLETEKETEAEKETESQTPTESESEQESQKDPESEVSQEPESVNEPETEPAPEPETQQETETETAPEPETEPIPDPMQEMPDPPKLTLVVYMAADNDLESYAIQNLKAMEHADFGKMNVLVLLDRSTGFDETNGDWTDTRLFELIHDETDSNIIVSKRISCPPLGLSNKVETELDMGNPSVLWNLMNYVRNNYESEKYALIIWGHGTGWRYSNLNNSRAVAIDDRSGSYMSVHDLGRALRNQGLSVIGFDTCFGGVFENVYELKNHAEYTVASPGITPSSGWDYTTLLEDISQSYFSSKEIAEIMADCSLVNSTIFNNQKLYSLMNDIEEFSKALAATINNSSTRNTVYSKLISTKSYSYIQYPCDMYLDIYSMAENYKSSSDNTLSSAAKKLQKTINSSARTTNTTNAEIGIHFIPKNGPNTTAAYHSIDYIKDIDNANQCAFIKESQGWVPTKEGESGSLLDKLFYASF